MRWPYIVSLIALLGAGLLLFFNVLCGASTSSVLGQFYWLQAGTSGIPGAHSTTRWTNYNSCGVRNGRNYDCSGKQAGYPMSPRANFGTTTGVPSGLSSRKGTTYYLSKVGWAFLLLGLLFTILALLPVALSFCLPGMSVLGIGSNFATNAALLFTVLSAALLTAGYVKARNAFRDDGSSTSLGKKMFAFIWTSVFLLFLSSLFSGVGCIGSMFGKRREKKRYSDNYDSSSHETYGNNYVHEKRKDPEQARGGFFSRKKRQNENLEDVGYAAGLGAAGVGTGATAAGAAHTRGVDTEDVSRDPNTDEKLEDVAYAAGYGASGATSDVTKQPQQAHTKDSSGLGTAAGVGAAGVAGAAVLNQHQSKKNDTIPESNEGEYDSGYGTSKDKSTAYGTSGAGEDLEDVAYAAGYGASGATSSITKQPQPAHTKDSSGLGTAAGVGAAGVAGAAALDHNQSKKSDNASKGKPSDSYNTGYGSSSKDKSTGYGTSGTAKGTGENLEDVAYAAGYGASGATSDKTRDLKGNTSGIKSGTAYGSSGNEASGYSSKPYDTGAATGYGSGKYDYTSKSTAPTSGQTGSYGNADTSSGSNTGLWGAAAAALGLGGAAAAAHGHRDSDQVDSNSVDRNATGGAGTTDSTGAYGTTGKGVTDDTGKHTTSGYGDDYQDQTDYGAKSGYNYNNTATTGTMAGVGTGAAPASGSNKVTSSSGAATRGPGYYSSEGTDVGDGATHAGANAVKSKKSKDQYENKSTALPVGTAHYNKDSYGNETQGYDTGVPHYGAASAATAAAVGAGAAGVGGSASSGSRNPGSAHSGNYYRTSKDGAAVRPEDTYKNLYANSKDDNDVTNTTGYEPTSYYTRKTGEDFNSGKETADTDAAGDKVYGAQQTEDEGPSSGRTGAAADDSTTSDATKGGFFGALLGRGNRKSKTYDDDSKLAKRGSTSSSVYDTQVPESDRKPGATSYDSSSKNKGLTSTEETSGNSANRSGYGDDYNSSSGKAGKPYGIDKNAALGAGAIGAGAAATYGAGKTGHKKELGQAKDVYDKHGDKVNDFIGNQGKKSKNDNTQGVSSTTSNPLNASDSSKTTSQPTSGTKSYGDKSSANTQGETLDDVAYAAGFGATGATGAAGQKGSSYSSKDTSYGGKSSANTQGETLDDVAYAAGFGASGATADKSKLGKSRHGATGATDQKGSSYSSKDTSGTSDKNRYGQDYTSSHSGKGVSSSKSDNKGDIAASAAAALGLGSAFGVSKKSSNDSKYGDSGAKDAASSDYSSSKTSGAGTGIRSNSGDSHSYGGDSKSSGYGKYATDTSEITPVVDLSRNRNPIAEGLTGSSVGKPTTAGASSIPPAGKGSGTTSSGTRNVSDKGADVSGSHKDRTQSHDSTAGSSTGGKLESGIKNKNYEYGSNADPSSKNKGLDTGDKLSGATRKGDSYAHSSGTSNAGLGAAVGTSGREKSSSKSNSGRYEGESYYEDDSVPGTFPTDQVSSPTQKTIDTSGDNHYTTQRKDQSGHRSTTDDTKYTPRSSLQGEQQEADAQGNPIKKEGILDVIVDTAKSVI